MWCLARVIFKLGVCDCGDIHVSMPPLRYWVYVTVVWRPWKVIDCVFVTRALVLCRLSHGVTMHTRKRQPRAVRGNVRSLVGDAVGLVMDGRVKAVDVIGG